MSKVKKLKNRQEPDETKQVDKKDKGWWVTLPGILTGIAGIITAVAGLLVAIHALNSGENSEPEPGPSSEERIVKCDDNFEQLPYEIVNLGTRTMTIAKPYEVKPFVLHLYTPDGQVGSIILTYVPDEGSFEILSFVDTACIEIEASLMRGGRRYLVPSNETEEFRIEDTAYWIRFTFIESIDEIEVDFGVTS